MPEKSNQVAHLEIIQANIIRMAASSFLIKGWSVTLVTALFALAAVGASQKFIFLAYFPAVAFWILDAYYLGQEKLFRNLYDLVRGKDETNIDFSMDTSKVGKLTDAWIDGIISVPGLIFHLTVLSAVVVVTLIMLSQGGQP